MPNENVHPAFKPLMDMLTPKVIESIPVERVKRPLLQLFSDKIDILNNGYIELHQYLLDKDDYAGAEIIREILKKAAI